MKVEFEDGYRCRVRAERASRAIKKAMAKRTKAGRSGYARVVQVWTGERGNGET